MCFVNTDGMKKVGTLLRIQDHRCQENGQMVVFSKGVERFKVLQEIRKCPFMVCQVEMMPDIDDDIPAEVFNLNTPKFQFMCPGSARAE